MEIKDHAQAIIEAIDAGDESALQAFAVATCHAEDAYGLVEMDGDAARYALGLSFLKSLAIGQPAHSA